MKIDNENWIKMILCLAPDAKSAQDFLNYNCGVRYELSTIERYRNKLDVSYNDKSWEYLNELVGIGGENGWQD